jgi:ElaB/YqjD/DUF883 family membrane-anchored ribosome-binding protein
MEDEQVIRQQMEDTRTSLTDKLETLENKVSDTVQEATSAVSDTVASVKESIQDTVATVTDSVQDTVTTVKDTLHDGVESVKSMFDIPHLVEQHPWAAVAGSIAVGFCLERTFGKRTTPMTEKMAEASAPIPAQPGQTGYEGAVFPGAAAMQSRQGRGHHSTNGGHAPRARHEKAAKKHSLLSALAPEIEQVKGLALGALFGLAREMIVKAVPPEMGERLKEIMDNVTQKLGGKPLEQPFGEFGEQSSGEKTSGGKSSDQPHGEQTATESGLSREKKAGLGLGRERGDWQRGY